jgi:hypothetical protein
MAAELASAERIEDRALAQAQTGGVTGQGSYTGSEGAKRQKLPPAAWVLLAVAAIAIPVLAVAVSFIIATAPARGTSNTIEPFGAVAVFYTSLQRHDYERAHDILSEELAAEIGVADLEERWSALEKGRTLGLEIPNFEITGESARLSVVLRASDGEGYAIEIAVQRSNGVWRVTGPEEGLIPLR